jgi:drug/metabolite transporter (DMT)-like permease
VVALLLALGSSLCWGTSDFLGGVQSRRQPLLSVMLMSQAAGLAGMLVLAGALGKAPPDLTRLLPAIGAGAAGIVALTAFYRGLAIGTMSIVAPISATGAAVPVVVGIAGGERPAALQLAGIAAAIAGVILVSREEDPVLAESRRHTSERVVVTRAPSRTSILLALVAALGFGSFFVGLRSSARVDVVWALVSARAAGVALLALAAGVKQAPLIRDRQAQIALTAVGVLDLSANALYALATRHGLLSVVAVASSLYPLGTVVLARVLLGERVRRVQEVGIVAALTGVVLIAAG